MEFLATPEFRGVYAHLDPGTVRRIDEALLRLAENPAGAWARQSRVVGEQGSAWLITIRGGESDWALYWDQPVPDQPLRLLLLLAR